MKNTNGVRSAEQRMPAKLACRLENALKAYAVAASAAGVATLALTTPADAAPVCKNLTAELTYTATFALNPADQRLAPFNIAQSYHTFSTLTSTGINHGFFTRNLPGAEVAVSSKGFVADLASGASIGPGGRFGKGVGYGLIFTFTPYSNATYHHHHGNLQFGEVNYFGFRFLISGEPHYGWVRLKSRILRGIRTPHVKTDILAFGYEATPNTAILAGSCSAEASAEDGARQSHTGTEETAASPVPASLSMLALGADAVPLWRKAE